MRVLFWVLTLILLFGLIGFMMTNLEASTPITVWNTIYPDVPLFRVVLGSVLVGVVFTGIFAVAEGWQIRLENRRLRRQLHQLETEVNYLRTQPSSTPVREAAAVVATSRPALTSGGDEGLEPPSAPVYGTDPDDWPEDDADDVYSGGRAV